jgi:hypothetical protein
VISYSHKDEVKARRRPNSVLERAGLSIRDDRRIRGRRLAAGDQAAGGPPVAVLLISADHPIPDSLEEEIPRLLQRRRRKVASSP